MINEKKIEENARKLFKLFDELIPYLVEIKKVNYVLENTK